MPTIRMSDVKRTVTGGPRARLCLSAFSRRLAQAIRTKNVRPSPPFVVCCHFSLQRSGSDPPSVHTPPAQQESTQPARAMVSTEVRTAIREEVPSLVCQDAVRQEVTKLVSTEVVRLQPVLEGV